jgi:hypothetical protein
MQALHTGGTDMRAIICGALMALTVATVGAAQVDRHSANFVLPGCKTVIGEGREGINVAEQGYCLGVMDTLGLISSILNEHSWSCIEYPKGSTVNQGLRVVVRYIEARPQRMHESFAFLAIEALHNAWPCRKGQ